MKKLATDIIRAVAWSEYVQKEEVIESRGYTKYALTLGSKSITDVNYIANTLNCFLGYTNSAMRVIPRNNELRVIRKAGMECTP